MSCSVGDTGIEPVTSSVSGKRATAAPIAQSDAAVLNYRYFVSFCEVETGFEPVWTALQAAASPLGHSTVETQIFRLLGRSISERTTGFEPATLTLAR